LQLCLLFIGVTDTKEKNQWTIGHTRPNRVSYDIIVVSELDCNFEFITILFYFYIEHTEYTVNNTSDYILWALYRSYFKGISANIELQVGLSAYRSSYD
jgi:hypothetical protein